ncbi:MAG: TolC family protein [Chitinophagaceae bacterium]|nr:TolC family protein [Chitinophagaceae bacterium]
MKIRNLLLIACCLAGPVVKAQEKWDLRRCVDYALENNISVRQADLQARFSELTLKQGRAQQLPSLNINGNTAMQFGLNDNPTTGILENARFFSVGLQAQSQVTLFNWFSRVNTNKANELTLEADIEQTKKVQNDIALNVAVGYLQILLAREQVKIAENTSEQTKAQLERTRKLVDAGQLPELNAVQLEAQLARDSANIVAGLASVQSFELQLKALLNLDAAAPFEVSTPPVELIPIKSLAELQPETVYASALANLPQQKVNEIRIRAAVKSMQAAKAGMYPSIGAFGSLGTNYVNTKIPVYGPGPLTETGALVTIGGTQYAVQAPGRILLSETGMPLGRQFRNNFGQNIGLALSIPILNGRANRTAWERAKLNVTNLELTKEQGDMQLKQDIYKAYVDATSALQQYNANKKAVTANETAYEFAQKRYDQGLLSTYDLLNTQITLQSARNQMVLTQYDYVFKMKLLEFYRGQGLSL